LFPCYTNLKVIHPITTETLKCLKILEKSTRIYPILSSSLEIGKKKAPMKGLGYSI
jgi:hypothetical protein